MKAKLAPYKSHLEHCQGCGQCQPVYAVLGRAGNEAYGPRGHVAQLLVFLMGNLGWADIKPYMDTCLLCGQCARACPAGIPLDKIFQTARFASPLNMSIASRVALGALALPPTLLDRLQPALAAVQKTPFIIKRFPKRVGSFPPLAEHAFTLKADQETIAGKKRVLLFPGCIGRRFFPQMLDACVSALHRHGFEPILPENIACCGRPDALVGNEGALGRAAIRNLAIIAKYEFDFLASPCPWCVAAISKIWPELPLPRDKRKAAVALAAKAFDIATLLRQTLAGSPEKLRQNIFWHQPCLMTEADSLGARELAGCADARLRSAHCCGLPSHLVPLKQDNGADNRICRQLHQTGRKNIAGAALLEQILAAKPEMIATCCPGCMLEIYRLLRQSHARIPVRHSIELYAQS